MNGLYIVLLPDIPLSIGVQPSRWILETTDNCEEKHEMCIGVIWKIFETYLVPFFSLIYM